MTQGFTLRDNQLETAKTTIHLIMHVFNLKF